MRIKDEAWLERAAAVRPRAIALEAPGIEWTYAELLERARATATGEPGEPEPITLPPGPQFAVALHACLLSGAVAVPVDPRLGARERAALLATATPSPEAEHPLMVVHTSGTTGAPRPITLTHGNVLASALGSAVALGLDPKERWLCPLPLSHVGGLMVLLRSVIYATTAVLRPVDGAELDGASVASLVPTQLVRALDAGLERPRGLRAILLGGAGAPRALLERAAAAGVPVAQTYGLTQACSAVTISEPGDLETQGRPIPGVQVQIARDDEILVSGPTVAGARTLHTGDLGRLDARGRLVVIGRKSDMIVTGGENVAPAEVEAVLLEHPAVADAGVLGRPDREWGEAVTAQVVLRAPVEAEDLRVFCAQRLARFKVPKSIEVVRELPRTGSGKLKRRAM